jgi:hypothetical protein
MPLYILKTQYGKFRVTVNEDTQVDLLTREKKSIGKIITVGGRNKCVYIKALYKSDTAHLFTIVGGYEGSVGMINLAFTILKREMPTILHVELEDKSDFPCSLSEGNTVGISLALYEMMFHQMSWYERHFGAYLSNSRLREQYIESKPNFKLKPVTSEITFHNEDLNEILRPILDESTSWEDFFAKVYNMDTKCRIIFPWYAKILKILFNSISFERQTWQIDLYSEKIPTVEFETTQAGGTYTRRNIFNIKKGNYKTWADFSYDELYSLRYT